MVGTWRSGRRRGDKNAKKRSDTGKVKLNADQKRRASAIEAAEPSPTAGSSTTLPLPKGWDRRLQEIWDETCASVPVVARIEANRQRIEFLCRCEIALRAGGINPRPSLLSQVRLAREVLEKAAAKAARPKLVPPASKRQKWWPSWWSPLPEAGARPDERTDPAGAWKWDTCFSPGAYLDATRGNDSGSTGSCVSASHQANVLQFACSAAAARGPEDVLFAHAARPSRRS
jgi:hypothetical protein